MIDLLYSERAGNICGANSQSEFNLRLEQKSFIADAGNKLVVIFGDKILFTCLAAGQK